MSEVVIQRPRRWPLYLSLFLNVVLIAFIVAAGWKIRQARETFGGLGPWMPNQIEKVLPRDAAEKVRKIRLSHAAEFRPLFEAVRTSREAVRKQLDAEPFDPQALKAALVTMREADSAITDATVDVIVEIAAALTPAERALVREKARDFKRGPRREGRGAPPPGDPPIGIPPGEMPPPPEGPPPGEADIPLGIPPGEMPEPPPEATPAPTP